MNSLHIPTSTVCVLLCLGCSSTPATSSASSGGSAAVVSSAQGGQLRTTADTAATGGSSRSGNGGTSAASSPALSGGTASGGAGAASGGAGDVTGGRSSLTGGASPAGGDRASGGATSTASGPAGGVNTGGISTATSIGGGKPTGGSASVSGGVSGSGGVLGSGGRTATSVSDAGTEPVNIPGTNNPILKGLFADPNIVVFDGTFYIYPTTDGVANWGATSFSVFTSTNLVQWTNQGVILDVAKNLTWAKGRAWAPGIVRVGDTYYFYFSAETQIGVATSKSPLGPFKDAIGAPLVKTAQYAPQSIDPYVFVDDDGARYLLFGSGSGGLRIAKLNADMVSFANTPTNISPSGASGTLEGSGMFKRKGTYYLYWSEGDTRLATYKMAYARAQSALGPFTRLGTLLEQNTSLGILGPGGGTILAIPARDEYYVAYHRFKIPGGDGTNRETCIDRVTINSDGTMAPVKPSLNGLQVAVQP